MTAVESPKAPGKAVLQRWVWCGILSVALAAAADAPVVPMTVCEVLADLPSHEGKNIAVLGRYSFRRDGRWIGEEGCGSSPAMLALSEDSAAAPRPPGNFEIDAAALNKKFAEMVKHTALGKFRFGTPEYDRWAVVYGRVAAHKDAGGRAVAELVFR